MGANLSKDKSVPKTDAAAAAATGAKTTKLASNDVDKGIKAVVSSTIDLKSSHDTGEADDAATTIDADLPALELGTTDAPDSQNSDAIQL